MTTYEGILTGAMFIVGFATGITVGMKTVWVGKRRDKVAMPESNDSETLSTSNMTAEDIISEYMAEFSTTKYRDSYWVHNIPGTEPISGGSLELVKLIARKHAIERVFYLYEKESRISNEAWADLKKKRTEVELKLKSL